MNASRVALTILLTASALAASARESFTTQRYDVHLSVRKNRTLDVVEVITVRFSEPKHGLLRKIPLDYRNDLGRSRSIQINFGEARTKALTENLSRWSRKEGNRAQVQLTRDGDDYVIRIGSPDVTVDGPMRYTIAYSVTGALTDFEADSYSKARTELYWNATPAEWPTAIAAASADITFPNVPGSTPPMFRALLGLFGSTGGVTIAKPGAKSSGKTQLVSAKLTLSNRKKLGRAEASTKRALEMGQMLTVAVGMPKGAVAWQGPYVTERRTVPRDLYVDPNPGYSTQGDWPQFDPLTDKSAVGLFVFVPGLAIAFLMRKAMSMSPSGPLVVRFDPPEGVGPSECGVLIDHSVDPRDVVAGMISLAQKGAAKIRVGNPEQGDLSEISIELLHKHQGKDLTEFEDRLYDSLSQFGYHLSPESLAGRFGYAYLRLQHRLINWAVDEGYYHSSPSSTRAVVGLAGVGVAVLAAFFTFESSPISTFIGLLIAMPLCIVTAWGAPGMTEKGAIKHQEVEGLNEFIARAQSEQLRYATREMPAQALFERLLPYAVAFDLVAEWTEAFEGLEIMPPQWFEPSAGWSNLRFFDVVSSDLARFGAGMVGAVSPPSYSSSSSSGSSWGSGGSVFSGFGGGGGSFGGGGGGGSAGGGAGGGSGGSW